MEENDKKEKNFSNLSKGKFSSGFMGKVDLSFQPNICNFNSRWWRWNMWNVFEKLNWLVLLLVSRWGWESSHFHSLSKIAPIPQNRIKINLTGLINHSLLIFLGKSLNSNEFPKQTISKFIWFEILLCKFYTIIFLMYYKLINKIFPFRIEKEQKKRINCWKFSNKLNSFFHGKSFFLEKLNFCSRIMLGIFVAFLGCPEVMFKLL